MPSNETKNDTSSNLAFEKRIAMEDPSEFRPEMAKVGKPKESFRVFSNEQDKRYNIVRETYRLMHTEQTVESVTRRLEHWGKLDHTKMGIVEALQKLDAIVDESDPDVDVPNSFHAFQTAERIREAHPDKDWFHLIGLVHDLGKVIALYGEPHWATVGDTFPVGCAFSKKIVFPEFFADNPDSNHPVYSTKLGMYRENCGLRNVMMSFGHDEYMYRVLVGNNCKLPEEALYMVRFHSFYPWHSCDEYDYLCDDKDREMLYWVREFNKFDLYSKADELPDVEKLKPYYEGLIEKYIPGVLNW